jgi:hypothetical protein
MTQSWGKALGGLIGGALLGGAAAGLLALVGYTLYWKGGFEHMREEMIPIFLVLGSLGAMLGAAVGVAWSLSWIPIRDEPPSNS